MARYKCAWFSSFRTGVYNFGNHQVVGTRHHAERLLRLAPLLFGFPCPIPISPQDDNAPGWRESVLMCLLSRVGPSAGPLFPAQGWERRGGRTAAGVCSAGSAGWERQLGCLLDVLARNLLWGELRPMLFRVRMELPSEGPCKRTTNPS